MRLCSRWRDISSAGRTAHENYKAALMDMVQCTLIRSEEEVTENKVTRRQAR
ncbi:MAG: hypothetical protein V8R76_04140 [Faecalibacterium sp.]